IPGVAGLAIHHLYRTMAWLGEELPAAPQAQATPFAPRTVKDLIEEQLFAHRRDLFSELSVVYPMQHAGKDGARHGALEGTAGDQALDHRLAAGLLPQPAEQQRRADALACEPLRIAGRHLRQHDAARGIAGHRGGEALELATTASLRPRFLTM